MTGEHPVRSILGLAIIVLGVIAVIDAVTSKFSTPWAVPAATACVGAAFILWER
jgi:uncharacterized membrane protein HdeD (DUF308 family)